MSPFASKASFTIDPTHEGLQALLASLLALCSPCLSLAARANPPGVQDVSGECTSGSHIARGMIGEDLTKKRSPYLCDSAVIAFMDQSRQRVMVQFGLRGSQANSIIGFTGYMQPGGLMMKVIAVYMGSQRYEVADGYCKFFFQKPYIDGIACGAPIDQGGVRTVPVVAFKARPGQ